MTAHPPHIAAALERAADDAVANLYPPPDGRPRTRRLAIGDPQAPFEQFLAILDAHGALGSDGRLLADVELVSMGDHFDYGQRSERMAARESGLRLLAWLAAHPADQVTLLLGNHDTVRVGELADYDDTTFAAAQAEADLAYAEDGTTDSELKRQLLARHPAVPTAEFVARDYASFPTAQRELVTRLVRTRRFRLAHASNPEVLLVHAGITRNHLDAVGVTGQDAAVPLLVAEALNHHLDQAIAGWQGGALDLAPLHHHGSAATGEGRGILYHRPERPGTGTAQDIAWAPQRRFDPRELPLGLLQAVGHIRDGKCRKTLAGWELAGTPADGPLRHLATDGVSVKYGPGTVQNVEPGQSAMLFLDGGMPHVHARDYELLDLNTLRPALRHRGRLS